GDRTPSSAPLVADTRSGHRVQDHQQALPTGDDAPCAPTSERQEEAGRALEHDPPADQSPDQAALLTQEPDPGPAVGTDVQVRGADVPLLDTDRLVLDHDRGGDFLLAREREVVS